MYRLVLVKRPNELGEPTIPVTSNPVIVLRLNKALDYVICHAFLPAFVWSGSLLSSAVDDIRKS